MDAEATPAAEVAAAAPPQEPQHEPQHEPQQEPPKEEVLRDAADAEGAAASPSSRKRPREEEDAAAPSASASSSSAAPVPAEKPTGGDAADDPAEEEGPPILSDVPGHPYLSALAGTALLPTSAVRKIAKLDSMRGNVGSDALFLISKATECIVAELAMKAMSNSATRAAEEDAAAVAAVPEGQPEPKKKIPRLSYDDLRTSLVQMQAHTPQLKFLDRVLPERSKGITLQLPPAPAAPAAEPAAPAAKADADAAPEANADADGAPAAEAVPAAE